MDGYAAPQLHTHAVVFNVTERDNGQTRALQERSLFQSQQYATTVYRSELAMKLQGLGYEIERGKHGQPEIKGYSQEYLEASSPRRVQIKEHLQEIGREGAGAAQVAAHRTRDSKEIHSPEEVLKQHRELAARFGHQADRVVAMAREPRHEVQPEKTAQQSVTYSRNHVFERSAVQDERANLQAAIDRGMGQASYSQVRQEFEQRVTKGEFRAIEQTDGRAAPLYTTAEMMRMEREIVGHMQRGNQWSYSDPMRYSRTSKETGIEKGEYSRVLAVNAQANTLTVVRGNGEQSTYDPRRQVGVSVYREDEKRFSVGDRIQFTAPSQELKIANRDLGTVESIGRDGTMRLRLDDERKVEFNPQQHPHVDHGYAVTSYSSQGQTAERVLVNVDTELAAKDLLNSRMAYVSISRGQFDAQIFTDNREKLPQALGRLCTSSATLA